MVASAVSHPPRIAPSLARAACAALLVALHLALLGAGSVSAAEPSPLVGGGEAIAARQEGIWRYLAVHDLARALGAPVEASSGVLTLRSAAGVLTAFERAPDALWQRTGGASEEFSAASPVIVVDGVWYLPEDMVGVLGVTVHGDLVTLPDGRVRPLALPRPAVVPDSLSSEVIALGPGVEALRLYASSPSGPESVSLLAVDLGLLALAYPEQRVALDAQLRQLRADKALFLVITSLGPATWDPAIYVVQDGVEVLLRAPLAVQVLEGDPGALAPDAPVAAVAFLPPGFDLRRPLQIRWAGASGSLTLRR
jgi:hypothetical protein